LSSAPPIASSAPAVADSPGVAGEDAIQSP
jgi:hypothetical protein